MVLETTPSKLWQEIQAAEKKRDEHLESLEQHIRSYVGPWYQGGAEDAEFDPENTFFQFLSHAIPQWVSSSPAFKVDTRRPSNQDLVAEALEWGVERWAKDSEIVDTLQEVAVDYGFRWGCGIVSQTPQHQFRDMDDPVEWPQFARLSPKDFGWDSSARTFRQARLMFHRYPIDHEDLIAFAKEDKRLPEDDREGWDLGAIESLAPGYGMDDFSEPGEERHKVNRDQLVVYEVWVPEVELEDSPGPDEGFHGTIYTLAAGAGVGDDDSPSGSPTEIRDPRPYYGPRWGPYVLFGAWTVPDHAEPLSSIVATAGQHEQLNTAAKAADRAAKAYKRLVLVSGDDPNLQQVIANGENDFVFPVRNAASLQGKVVPIEIGGLTQQFISLLQLYQDRTNRTLALDEVQRGNIQGAGTATEVSAAVEASAGRRGHEQARFQRGVKQMAKTVLWYLYHNDRVMFPLGRDANEAFEDMMGDPEREDVWFIGGDFDKKSGATFDDLELDIEPLSMERTTQASLRRRTGFLMEFLTGLGPALPQLAQVGFDVPRILRMVGDGENIPYLDDIVDVEQLGKASQTEQQALPAPILARQGGEAATRPGSFARGVPVKRGPDQAAQTLSAPQGAPGPQQPQPQPTA